MTTFRALLLVATTLLAMPAIAEEPAAQAAPTFADIVAMIKDKNAKYKLDKLAPAVEASNHAWRPRDVYELLDLGAPPDVLKLAAGKAKMFWDGSAKALPAVITNAREGAPSETVKIATNDDLVIVFEHFNDIKYEIEAAKSALGALAPRASYEDDVKYDMRTRDFDIRQAQTMSPFEGRIAKTTFDIELTGGFTPHDGACTRPTVVVDLTKVNFDLFRYTLGGLRVEVPVSLDAGSNVEAAKFAATGQYRFEATGKPICVSAAQAATLSSQGSKLRMTLRRPFDSDNWTGTASFVNAKTNTKL